ncbi:tripartite-type tricarboxylate transporter receptor subunit TctC [Chromatocurvus halotolerans]|uniref:Tripartite-type tricarboxylate transporter receptor subunit TctC n=2 Tax=Chromatocurvus halotolerans TaxID=1132028 RepID=A0A4R2KS43_9GAMM|nr:tripartite-type tricarboxylate transporter receptor subunit TctC [Chromatocurvus halotolerans]
MREFPAHRLRCLRALLICIPLCLMAGSARADAFPTERPIRLLTPYGAGGGIDIAARILSAVAEPHLGTRVDVVNMPGAGGLNAAMFTLDAKPDGYTLMISDYGPLITLPLREDTDYGPEDWTPVFQITEIAPTFVVHPDFPEPTLPGVMAAAAREPGRLHATHGAFMSSSHLPLLRLEQISELRMNHVPTLGGGETLQFLLASIVSLAVTNSSSIASAVEGGSVAPVAVATRQRIPELPETPTLLELGYDVVMPVWYTIFAPADVPEPRRRELAARIASAFDTERARSLAARASITLSGTDYDSLQQAYADTVATVTATISALQNP